MTKLTNMVVFSTPKPRRWECRWTQTPPGRGCRRTMSWPCSTPAGGEITQAARVESVLSIHVPAPRFCCLRKSGGWGVLAGVPQCLQ